MTSQSLKKLRTTAPNSPTRANSNPSSRGWIRIAFLSSLPIGLAISSQSDAQQSPAWSPQPYVKPTTDTIPKNSLRVASGSDASNEVIRWRKVEGAPHSLTASYSQALPSEPITYQQPTSRPSDASVIRQPSSTVSPASSTIVRRNEMLNGSAQLQPATGWAPKNTVAKTPAAEPAKIRTDNNVQFASFEATAGAERANSGMATMPSRLRLNPSEASSRRFSSHGVQRASYQEDAPGTALQLPQTPSTMPQLPSAGGLDHLPPSQQPRPDFGIEPPQRSLLEKKSEDLPSRPLFDSPSDRSRTEDPYKADQDIEPAPPKRPAVRSTVDCDTIRQVIETSDITKIRVDSSPTFVEGYKSEKSENRTNSKDSFSQNAPVRQWYNADGILVAEGRLVDIVYGSVVLETASGSRTTYLVNKLSDADQVYVSESWGIPFTCSMGDGSFDARNFTATTMTWKASGACHKPLYFEEVQLERYGHEWGPWVQPAISSLNFVKNVAFLPYKMGIHPMNECQYSLGYYRPGSCAPWTVGPIPISLRGAAAQAAAVSGAALALP